MAATGVLLAVSFFLPYFGAEETDESAKAWEAWAIFDVLLTAIAIGLAVIAIARITGAIQLPVPAQLPLILAGVAFLATWALSIELVWGLEGVFKLKIGGYLALLASAGLLAGAVISVRPDLQAKVNEATANIGSGGGPGAGAPGPGPGAPGPGAPGPGASAPTPQAPAQPAAPSAPAPEPTVAGQPATAPQPAGPAESSGPAAGWYPDPQGQKRLRYWDGSRWTEQTAD